MSWRQTSGPHAGARVLICGKRPAIVRWSRAIDFAKGTDLVRRLPAIESKHSFASRHGVEVSFFGQCNGEPARLHDARPRPPGRPAPIGAQPSLAAPSHVRLDSCHWAARQLAGWLGTRGSLLATQKLVSCESQGSRLPPFVQVCPTQGERPREGRA